MLGNMIKAEHLKTKRTFGRILPIVAPVVTLLLVFLLTGGIENAFPSGAWNWWYTMLLPETLAILCYLNITKEKKNQYYNLKSFSTPVPKLLFGKILYIAIAFLIANLVMLAGTVLGGAVLGSTISAGDMLLAALLLTISYLWEIPLYLFLSAKWGMIADILLCMLISMGSVVTLADKSIWWVCPSAIPIRFMCPVLGILPNGLPVPSGSILADTGVIFSGTVLSVLWFVAGTFLVGAWFEKMEVK